MSGILPNKILIKNAIFTDGGDLPKLRTGQI